MQRRTVIWTRIAAVVVLLWSFGSYGLSRHGHEPFPTGRFPGFENAPLDGDEVVTAEFVIVAGFADGVREFSPEDLFPDAGVSLKAVFSARVRPTKVPSGGLAELTWRTVGPESPVRRNQPLIYAATPATREVFTARIEELVGRSPDVVTVERLTRRLAVDDGAQLSAERSIVAEVCDGCAP